MNECILYFFQQQSDVQQNQQYEKYRYLTTRKCKQPNKHSENKNKKSKLFCFFFCLVRTFPFRFVPFGFYSPDSIHLYSLHSQLVYICNTNARSGYSNLQIFCYFRPRSCFALSSLVCLPLHPHPSSFFQSSFVKCIFRASVANKPKNAVTLSDKPWHCLVSYVDDLTVGGRRNSKGLYDDPMLFPSFGKSKADKVPEKCFPETCYER